jgi:hypothetical protein
MPGCLRWMQAPGRGARGDAAGRWRDLCGKEKRAGDPPAGGVPLLRDLRRKIMTELSSGAIFHVCRCDNGCQTTGCYFHPDMGTKEQGLDTETVIPIPEFIRRFGCASYSRGASAYKLRPSMINKGNVPILFVEGYIGNNKKDLVEFRKLLNKFIRYHERAEGKIS